MWVAKPSSADLLNLNNMASPITSSDFGNQTSNLSLCDQFREKLLNNGKMQQLLDYMFVDPDGTLKPSFVLDLAAFMQPIGTMRWSPFAVTTSPANGAVWLLCDGTSIPVEYTGLIAQAGSTTPDMRGKFPLGVDQTHGIGTTGGEFSTALALVNIPYHSHDLLTGSSNGTQEYLGNGVQTIDNGSDGGGPLKDPTYRDNGENFSNTLPYVKSAGGDPLNSNATEAHNTTPPYRTGYWYVLAGYNVANVLTVK